MKKRQRKTYWQCLRRQLGIMLLVWVLLMYSLMQAAYLAVFHKMEQRTTVNFYEGMEIIQYMMKDTALLDEQVEVRMTLNHMSHSGEYFIAKSDNPVIKNYGNLVGLQLGWMRNFLLLSGICTDGNDNVILGGCGKDIGFILDAETKEVVFDSTWKEDVAYLYLRSDGYVGNSKDVTFTNTYQDMLFCPYKVLEPYNQELSEITDYWYQYYKEHDPDYTEKNLRWWLDEFYVKNDQFVPAKVSLYYSDIRSYMEARGDDRHPDVLVETKTFYDQSLSGYELYVVDHEKETATCLELGVKLSPKSDLFNGHERWKPDDAFREKALEAILENQELHAAYNGYTSDIGNGWSVGNPFLYFLNGEMVFVRTAYFSDVTGHTYMACVYQNVSELLGQNRVAVSTWAKVLAIFLILLAFITSYMIYLRAKQVFLTKEYREMLMESMAHDLKSPLMAVSGYADNLREHINEEKRDHYAEQIQKSVGYMNEIVMRNLEILKYDKETKKIVRKDMNMRQLFEESFERYQGEMEER
ncbi:MAG: hypothetical protein J6Z22_05060, partial [Lachnospiraceae bacterium]|nr:hypothetical protein [Lachnospiraceae bacterium]